MPSGKVPTEVCGFAHMIWFSSSTHTKAARIAAQPYAACLHAEHISPVASWV